MAAGGLWSDVGNDRELTGGQRHSVEQRHQDGRPCAIAEERRRLGENSIHVLKCNRRRVQNASTAIEASRTDPTLRFWCRGCVRMARILSKWIASLFEKTINYVLGHF
jgi:hypothetical protein